MSRPIVVLDNGGADIKIGFANNEQPTSVFPNAVAKLKGEKSSLIGDQILDCTDVTAVTLRRPTDRGYVVNWELQTLIWDRAFKSALHCKPHHCGLVLTEPFFTLPAVQSSMDQAVFEEFGFPSYLPVPAPQLALRSFAAQRPYSSGSRALSGLVVDCGFSFTHVAPIFDGQVLLEGVRRINVGGKALSNYLKELVSFRSINIMEETYLVEHIKEVACFVSQNLTSDLAASKAGKHSCMYVLPDGVSNGKGFLRPPLTKEQQREAVREGKEVPALSLNNERFMVPELVFHPDDIGMEQAGLAETVVEAANSVHPDLRPLLFSNIVCVGGTTTCPGFHDRLAGDLRSMVPSEYEVEVHSPVDPRLAAWQGGALLGRSHEYSYLAFTKAEYEERGSLNMRLH